jgi:hypothetical protein
MLNTTARGSMRCTHQTDEEHSNKSNWAGRSRLSSLLQGDSDTGPHQSHAPPAARKRRFDLGRKPVSRNTCALRARVSSRLTGRKRPTRPHGS